MYIFKNFFKIKSKPSSFLWMFVLEWSRKLFAYITLIWNLYDTWQRRCALTTSKLTHQDENQHWDEVVQRVPEQRPPGQYHHLRGSGRGTEKDPADQPTAPWSQCTRPPSQTTVPAAASRGPEPYARDEASAGWAHSHYPQPTAIFPQTSLKHTHTHSNRNITNNNTNIHMPYTHTSTQMHAHTETQNTLTFSFSCLLFLLVWGWGESVLVQGGITPSTVLFFYESMNQRPHVNFTCFRYQMQIALLSKALTEVVTTWRLNNIAHKHLYVLPLLEFYNIFFNPEKRWHFTSF